jgi:hypothetical protein
MTTSRALVLAAAISSCLFARAAVAHTGGDHGEPGHHAPGAELRLWKNVKTDEAVRGYFLSFRDDHIQVERENGEIISFAMADLGADDRRVAAEQIARIQQLNGQAAAAAAASQPATQPATQPAAALPFGFFAPQVATHWDDRFLYVESNGIPGHRMMVGIRAWQQQIPLPQPYGGQNAWRIPLMPVPAKTPVSAKDDLFRGAIALAANGVPIFNPIKNDGKTDTFLAGELDEFGGHCGRADDYHYHIAPLHLQKTIGNDLPIAYALDGYPILGLLGEKGCPIAGAAPLDNFNGHAGAGGLNYHYHASKTYPYINGGMHGEVTVRGGQIDPQPKAQPMREAGNPLRGASITGFDKTGDKAWKLTYTVGGATFVIEYQIEANGNLTYALTGPDGKVDRKTFRGPPKEGPPDAGDPARPAERRRPWIVVHASEMDANHDGALSLDELNAEIDRTFKGYDRDHDGVVTRQETRDPLRSVLGGFVQQHFEEIGGSEKFAIEDFRRSVQRMFDKADANRDHTLDAKELASDNETPSRKK